jgi:hypothetical protein
MRQYGSNRTFLSGRLIPLAASLFGSMTIFGISSAQSQPAQPAHVTCNSGTDFGQLMPGVGYAAKGTLQGFGQVDYFRFFITQYSFTQPVTFGPKPLQYSYQIVDDLTGDQYDPGIVSGFELSLDPGFYCLKVFNPQVLSGVPYNISLSAQQAGIPPSPTQANALPVSQNELGNLSHNGYHQDSRYIFFHNNPHPTSGPPLTLTPGHEYVLRDWVGSAIQNQWYKFSLDGSRNVTLHLQNLYLGTTVTIETTSGEVVATTVNDNASPLGPLLPTQSFKGALPAGMYYLHISFVGNGSPGTTFSLSLTTQ